MANVNPLIDLSVEPVTRATLQSMWNGALSALTVSDLSDDAILTTSGSDFSDAPTGTDLKPGALFWHADENVMYAWHDEVDSTGVSLWLAIGPDKFETAVLAEEPIGAGMPLTLSYDRRVVVSSPHVRGVPRVMGFNQSGIHASSTANDSPYGGVTTASGAWMRAGVDGLVFGVVSFATSHETQAQVQWSEAAMLTLEVEDGTPMGLIEAAQVSSPQDVRDSPIGIATQWCVTDTGGTVTESAFLLKFAFHPRMFSQAYFE